MISYAKEKGNHEDTKTRRKYKSCNRVSKISVASVAIPILDFRFRILDLFKISSLVLRISYAYDYQGRRIKKIDYTLTPTSYTLYCYDGEQIIADYNDSGVLQRKFIYGSGIDEPLMMINVSGQNETKYYYHFDGLGSVTALSNSGGSPVESYSYDVYGEPNRTSSIGNTYMFTARNYDSETENYYYRARYYNPAIGRFLQPDPIGYNDGLNIYAYVHNNPVMNVDPSGMAKCTITLYNGWSLDTSFFRAEIYKQNEHWAAYSIQQFSADKLNAARRKTGCCCFDTVKVYDHGYYMILPDGSKVGRQVYGERLLMAADLAGICPWLCKKNEPKTQLQLYGCYIGVGDRINFQDFFDGCSRIKEIKACRGKVYFGSGGYQGCDGGWRYYSR